MRARFENLIKMHVRIDLRFEKNRTSRADLAEILNYHNIITYK